MSTIYLDSHTTTYGIPLPGPIGAYLSQRVWTGGGTVPEMILQIGSDTLHVWPITADQIDDLVKKLGAAREALEKLKGEGWSLSSQITMDR